MDGQPFLFGDGRRDFPVDRFEVKNSVGEIIGLLVRVAERAVPDQQFADFRLGLVGRLGVGKVIRADRR